MSRRRAAEKRQVLPDAVFGDTVLTKFMNSRSFGCFFAPNFGKMDIQLCDG